MIKSLLVLSSFLGVVSAPTFNAGSNYPPDTTETPIAYTLTQNFQNVGREFLSFSGGQFRAYRYKFRYNISPAIDTDLLSAIQNTKYMIFELPLSFLNYDYTQGLVGGIPLRLSITGGYHGSTNIIPTTIYGVELVAEDTFAVEWRASYFTNVTENGLTFQFDIPTTDTIGNSNALNSTIDNQFLMYNRRGLKANLFDKGYSSGYRDGEINGYNNGYNAGMNDAVNNNISYSWLRGLFSGMGDLLGIRLFGDITIGSVALIMLSLTLLPFIIGLAKGKD